MDHFRQVTLCRICTIPISQILDALALAVSTSIALKVGRIKTVSLVLLADEFKREHYFDAKRRGACE